MRAVAWLSSVAAVAAAASVLKNEFGQREICRGVYGPGDTSGKHAPFVNVSFPTKGDTEGELAVIVFDYDDLGDIGYRGKDEMGNTVVKYFCDQDSVYAGECQTDDLGKFIVSSDARGRIKSERVAVGGGREASELTYPVTHTGYFCVAADPVPGHEAMKFSVEVSFQNAYGYLPGKDYPLLLFHFVQALVYVGIVLLWTVLLVLHRHSVLKVQKYITAMGVIMVLEQTFVALYYFLINRQGQNAGTKVLLTFVALWVAARLAFTFFLLTIVACGYSVVHPSLGTEMRDCRLLAGLLFITAFAFNVLDYYESNTESSGSWLDFAANLTFFPFVIALACNYFKLLISLKRTVAYLRSRKQSAKVFMYRKLGWILFGALIAAAAQCIVVIIQVLVTPLRSFISHYWKYKWFLYDGWPNIVYCVAMMLIMFIWRPSKDNMRYAMSTQLSQNENDADEFEIGSLHGSDVDDDEPHGADDSFGRQSGLGGSGYERAAASSASASDIGAQRNTMFDAEANHGLSDLESGDEFEVRPEDRRPLDDEDPLVAAPTQQLRKSR